LWSSRYTSYTGYQYNKGGHVLRNSHLLLRQPPMESCGGNELFPYPHMRHNLTALLGVGECYQTTGQR
jgi:hypothetical protein